jgi:hypothetical protein
VRKWLKARQVIARAEAIKKELQPHLEKALEKAPDQTREFGVVTLSLCHVTTKRFNAKAAEEELGAELIAAFWDESTHTRINVK